MQGGGVLAGAALAALMSTMAFAAPHAPPPPSSGLKHTVAVYQFQTPDVTGASSTADGLTALLTDALMRDGRFVVVEREDLANLTQEQQLGSGNQTTAETAAKSGQMIGASLIIRGSVTKYEPNAGSSGISFGVPVGDFGQQSGLGVKGGKSVIAIALRVIDSTTGQVVATVKTQGTASSHEVDVSATNHSGANLQASSISNTPFGKAAEDAIDKAVPQLVLAADQQPWTAAVVEVDGDTVYVNAGANENLQAGTVLHVSRKTKVLTDPNTGAVLDTLMADVGDIKVGEVREKVSTAAVVDGTTPQRGDLLQLQPGT